MIPPKKTGTKHQHEGVDERPAPPEPARPPSRDTARTASGLAIAPEPMAKSRAAWIAGTAAAKSDACGLELNSGQVSTKNGPLVVWMTLRLSLRSRTSRDARTSKSHPEVRADRGGGGRADVAKRPVAERGVEETGVEETGDRAGRRREVGTAAGGGGEGGG